MIRIFLKSRALHIYNNKHLNKMRKQLSHFDLTAVSLSHLDIFYNIFVIIYLSYYYYMFRNILESRAVYIYNNKQIDR